MSSKPASSVGTLRPLRRRAATLRIPRASRPQIEPLEGRPLMSDGPGIFAHFRGHLTAPLHRDTIPVRVTPDDFTTPFGRITWVLTARAMDGGPVRARIVPHGGAGSRSVFRTGGRRRRRRVRRWLASAWGNSRSTSTPRGSARKPTSSASPWRVMPTETGGVGRKDLRLIRSSLGRRHGRPGYRPEADVNRNGVVGGRDLLVARQDLGAATRVRPLLATLALGPASDPDGDGVVDLAAVTVVGRSPPGAVVQLDQGVDGSVDQTTTVGADGAFRFAFAVGAGVNRLRVTASDSFGQTATAELTVTRSTSKPPTTDTRPPTVEILGPNPGLVTNTNVRLVGRTLDDSSGVAALESSVDGSPFAAAAFDPSGDFAIVTALTLDGTADGRTPCSSAPLTAPATPPPPPSPTFTLDTRAPAVAILGPTSGVIANSNVTVTGRVSDVGSGVAALESSVDGGPFAAVAFDASGDFVVTTALPLDGTADGAHTVRLRATDRAGNSSAPAEATFILDIEGSPGLSRSPRPWT